MLRKVLKLKFKHLPTTFATTALAALAIAGCSQTGGMGDRPAWGLLGGSKETAAPPPAVEAPKYVYRGGRDAATERASNGLTLPNTYSAEPMAEPKTQAPHSVESARVSPARSPAPPTPIRQATSVGETVTVAPGDTLYAIAQRHHVSLTGLMASNNLQSATIHAGQQLVLPR